MMINIKLPMGPAHSQYKQLAQFIHNPTKMLMENYNKYGKCFTLKFPGQPPYVVISDPDDIKKVLTSNAEDLHAGEINGSVFKPVLGEYSLLTLDGKKHIHHRKLLLPSFHGESIKLYGENIQKIVSQHINRWKHGNKNNKILIFNEVREIAFEIIIQVIFGIGVKSSHYFVIKNLLRELLRVIKSPLGLLTLMTKTLQKNLSILTPWSKIQHLKRKIDLILFQEMANRKNSDLISRSDILSLLLQAKGESGEYLSDQEVRDEMMTLLIAGHETSATTISWCIYYILSYPLILEKIIFEMKEINLSENSIYQNIDRLKYLDCIIKESLRITPVIPYIARLTQTEYQLKNRIIPQNVAIVPSIYLAHHDTNYWPEPDKFYPERFMMTSETPYTFLPFGGGVRRCIGAAFAMYEIKIVIASILLTYKMTLRKNYVPKFIRKGIVIAPSEGVPVFVQPK